MQIDLLSADTLGGLSRFVVIIEITCWQYCIKIMNVEITSGNLFLLIIPGFEYQSPHSRA